MLLFASLGLPEERGARLHRSFAPACMHVRCSASLSPQLHPTPQANIISLFLTAGFAGRGAKTSWGANPKARYFGNQLQYIRVVSSRSLLLLFFQHFGLL